MYCVKSFLFCVFAVSLAFAVPKPEDKKSRSFEREPSKAEHYPEGEHDKKYDHEAFLGEDAESFEHLAPEESKRRLGLIVDKIDNNKDGMVTHEELKDWIRYTQKKYIMDDVDTQWKHNNPENLEAIPWADYHKLVYGFLGNMDANDESMKEDGFSYKAMLKRDRRRWTAADLNADDKLNKEEFAAFLHPEESGHMRDLVIQEAMEDVDKDGDGQISIDEYIGDVYRGEDNDEEPEWVKTEREQFATYRDKDQNGFMDEEEVKNWILPEDFDHAEAEARHLIYEADEDADHQLTKEEILNKYDLFVGSQATDFGNAITRHDEF